MNIGVDILDIRELPNYSNYKESRFFLDNFSTNEINYAKNNKNTMEVFARLFCSKESIIKADNKYLGTNFNKIELSIISYNNYRFNKLFVSTSISKYFCVSFAIRLNT